MAQKCVVDSVERWRDPFSLSEQTAVVNECACQVLAIGDCIIRLLVFVAIRVRFLWARRRHDDDGNGYLRNDRCSCIQTNIYAIDIG